MYNKLIDYNSDWNVRTVINFSFLPGINDALEGDTRLKWFASLEGWSSEDDASDPDNPTGIG